MPKRTNKTKLGRLFNKAWKAWSLYRRTNAKDFQDNVTCYTCSKKINYKEAHLGHYFHGKLDFSEICTQIQCAGCNLFKHGELGKYGENLIRDYGFNKIQELRFEANQPHKYTIPELEGILKQIQND